MIAMCTRSDKCGWRTVDLGDDFEMAHILAASHGIDSHIEYYTWHIPRDSVFSLSLLEQLRLSFYTDFSGMSRL